MPVSIADLVKGLSGMEVNPRAMRELGAAIADGMQQGGNARSYSPHNPTGSDQGAGVAGGRGSGSTTRDQADYIKSEQLKTEINRKVFDSYKKLNKQLDHTSKHLDDMQSDISVFAKAFANEWGDAMDKVERSTNVQRKLIANLNALGFEEIKTTEDLLELRERQQKLEKQLIHAKGAERLKLKKEAEQYKKMSKAMAKATKGIDSMADKTKDWLSNTGKAFFSLENVLFQFTLGITRLMGDVGASMKFGADTSNMGIFNDQLRAAQAGMDPAAWAEMTAGARQAAYQFDNMDEFSTSLLKRQREYYGYIGDSGEAAQFATNSYMLLGKAGIDPTSKAFDRLGDSFLYLNKAAGVTADQFNGMMETLVADENIQVRLRAASEKERGAIMAGISNRIKENVAIGMSTEKSLEAARAMGRIAGGDAKERFKQAAMAQMALGSMGVAGGDRAAELIRKGQRMDDNEREELQQIMGNASQFMAQTKTGGIGGELAFGTIMQKSGLDQYMGPSSPFNVTLEKQLALDKKANEEIIAQIKDGPGGLANSKWWIDIFKNGIMESPLVPILSGIAATVGVIAMTRGAAGLFGGRMSGVAGRAGRGLMNATGVSALGRGALGVLPAGAAATMGTGLATAGAGAIAGTAAGGLALGGLLGTGLNNFAKLWGGRQFSTTLLDTFTDFNDYDPNEDYKHLMQDSADKTAELVDPTNKIAEVGERSLSTQEQILQVTLASYEMQQGEAGKANARNRISNLQNGQQASTVQ